MLIKCFYSFIFFFFFHFGFMCTTRWNKDICIYIYSGEFFSSYTRTLTATKMEERVDAASTAAIRYQYRTMTQQPTPFNGEVGGFIMSLLWVWSQCPHLFFLVLTWFYLVPTTPNGTVPPSARASFYWKHQSWLLSHRKTVESVWEC